MRILKTTQYKGFSEIRYNVAELDGSFVSEGNGFYNDNHNGLIFTDNSKIINIWYKLIYDKSKNFGKIGISFIKTLQEAKRLLNEFKILD